jgi:hypothetical protein
MLQAGQRVQIKEAAFYGSTNPDEIHARGQSGELLFILETAPDGDHLWLCRCDNGADVEPLETELDVIEEQV